MHHLHILLCVCVQATASDSLFWMLMALPALFLAWYVPPLTSLPAIFLSLFHPYRAFACSILAVLYLSFSATCSGACQGDVCGAAIGRQVSAPQPRVRVLRACRCRIARACLLRHEDGQAPCYSVIELCIISAARGRLSRGFWAHIVAFMR